MAKKIDRIAELEKVMTPKQVKLARALAAGGIPKVQAYKQVYSWRGTSANALAVEANKATNHPKVAMLATELRERDSSLLWGEKERFRQWIMKGITDTVSTTDSDITRLKALELAGRTRYASIFEEPSANETTAQVHGAIADTLRLKLQALIGGSDAGPGPLRVVGAGVPPRGVGVGLWGWWVGLCVYPIPHIQLHTFNLPPPFSLPPPTSFHLLPPNPPPYHLGPLLAPRYIYFHCGK